MWVVKLGGSLFDSPALPAWLDALAATGVPLVVVPGGGPFADQVRRAQAHWGFDDAAGHRMALLAMEQMAVMLGAIDSRYAPVADAADIRRTLWMGRLPVWLPGAQVLASSDVAADWSVTSDSLAAWLAARCAAAGLLLVKSAPMPWPGADIERLQAFGLLDEAFHRLAERLACPVRLLHREDRDGLRRVLVDKAAGRRHGMITAKGI
jgi:5-(aminomethyl)-3-furanmethanol phosphate kinase